jgi:hypothetical protein
MVEKKGGIVPNFMNKDVYKAYIYIYMPYENGGKSYIIIVNYIYACGPSLKTFKISFAPQTKLI